MGTKRILSDAQLDEMAGLRERGWGVDRIAKHFTDSGTPISPSAINWQCMRVGADTLPRLRGRCAQAGGPHQRGNHVVRPFTTPEDALLRSLDGAGTTVAAMARRLDRKPNSIRGRLMTLARRDARTEEAGVDDREPSTGGRNR